MKNSNKQYLYSVLRQAWHELGGLWSHVSAMLMRTPLPRVLILCVGLALVITLVPLILTLFVIFMLIKLILLAMVMNVRGKQSAETSFSSRYRNREWSTSEAEDAQLVRIEQTTTRNKDR
ncbi:hypothetical protein [Undibacterium fentianense]|uniref:Uncharacterized protein n=1 Tax=Undibacterium fentianense TaxID=2828728 RepID=A0A941E264_9BURK|nr:hypothetical protein [Undibacterium fentianense]MBR7800016.1 hypothetical protein [Undibacterium fentianense]